MDKMFDLCVDHLDKCQLVFVDRAEIPVNNTQTIDNTDKKTTIYNFYCQH